MLEGGTGAAPGCGAGGPTSATLEVGVGWRLLSDDCCWGGGGTPVCTGSEGVAPGWAAAGRYPCVVEAVDVAVAVAVAGTPAVLGAPSGAAVCGDMPDALVAVIGLALYT